MSQTDMAGCSGVDSAPDTPWLSEGSGKRRLLLGVRPSSAGTFYPQPSLPVNLTLLGLRASPQPEPAVLLTESQRLPGEL